MTENGYFYISIENVNVSVSKLYSGFSLEYFHFIEQNRRDEEGERKPSPALSYHSKILPAGGNHRLEHGSLRMVTCMLKQLPDPKFLIPNESF